MGKVIRGKNIHLISAKEKVKSVVFTQHPKLKESHPQDIEISISLRDKDILKELLELSSTTQDVDAP